jgi:hypothetical protein
MMWLVLQRGGRSSFDRLSPCSPQHLINCIEHLYRTGRLSLIDVRVLLTWSERGHSPARDEHFWPAWSKSLAELTEPLIRYGIVRRPPMEDDGAEEPLAA